MAVKRIDLSDYDYAIDYMEEQYDGKGPIPQVLPLTGPKDPSNSLYKELEDYLGQFIEKWHQPLRDLCNYIQNFDPPLAEEPETFLKKRKTYMGFEVDGMYVFFDYFAYRHFRGIALNEQ